MIEMSKHVALCRFASSLCSIAFSNESGEVAPVVEAVVDRSCS